MEVFDDFLVVGGPLWVAGLQPPFFPFEVNQDAVVHLLFGPEFQQITLLGRVEDGVVPRTAGRAVNRLGGEEEEATHCTGHKDENDQA